MFRQEFDFDRFVATLAPEQQMFLIGLIAEDIENQEFENIISLAKSLAEKTRNRSSKLNRAIVKNCFTVFSRNINVLN